MKLTLPQSSPLVSLAGRVSLVAGAAASHGGGRRSASRWWAPQRLTVVGVDSAVMLLILSATLWAAQWRVARSKWNATWARAVFMSGFWLVVTIYLRADAGASGPAAYRDGSRALVIKLAVFGFAMNSIYGFGQMLLPGLLRIGKPRLGAIDQPTAVIHTAGVLGTRQCSTRSTTFSRIIRPKRAPEVLRHV